MRLFTPEILDRIDQVVVGAGHRLVKKSADKGLNIRCDFFVVETDVHHPTDSNLLLDAVRKAIEISAQLCRDEGLSDWRQSAYSIRQLKKAYRRVQQLNRSKSQDEAKREARQAEIEQAYRDYLELAEELLARVRDTRAMLHIGCGLPEAMLAELDAYIADSERQIDRIRRRVLHGERIACLRRRSSLSSNATPSGSTKARPACRSSWGCAWPYAKTNRALSCTTK